MKVVHVKELLREAQKAGVSPQKIEHLAQTSLTLLQDALRIVEEEFYVNITVFQYSLLLANETFSTTAAY